MYHVEANIIMETVSVIALIQDFIVTLLSSALAVIMGLVVKLALEWDKNRLTWKSAFVQTMFSVGIGYMTYFWLDGKGIFGLRQEVILFIMSLAAAHIVSAINSVSRDKSRSVVEQLLERVVATKKEVQKIQEADDKFAKEEAI
jgi:hypothetical protein